MVRVERTKPAPVVAEPTLFDHEDPQPTDVCSSTPLVTTTFCIIDLETTGTSSNARITEIGAVKVRSGEVLGEFQTLVNPGVAIPGFITTLTGITNHQVAGAPRLASVLPSLVEFCRGCVMVAHNASFDMGFIVRACAELGYDWPAPVVLDTVTLARRIVPRQDVANYRLSTLASYFDTPAQPSHRALDDARATVDVLHRLLERVGNQGVRTLEDLQQFSYVVSPTRRAKHVWAGELPEGPGVYFFVRDSEDKRKYLYVGTSKHVRRRVATYFTASEQRRRMEEMVALATGVEAVECHTGLEAAIVELRLITAHQPPYNRRSKQPRQTWIKVTDEPIPRLSVVRKIRDDQASYCGPFSGRAPADQAILALGEAFPLRACTERLSPAKPRQPCALAEMASCPAPCTGDGLAAYADLVEQVKQCFNGDVRPVRAACLAAIGTLSDQYRYEEAGEILERLRAFEHGLVRQARLRALAGCPQMIAARALGGSWEIHVIRYGQLAGAGVAQPGDDPVRVAADVAATAKTVSPGLAGLPAGSIEEAELIAGWLEQSGVRLIDIEGTWGWPVNTH